MIPKVIHYCWFGGKDKPEIVKKCLLSWKKYCPDYEIKEWNESNFDINSNNFTKKMYSEKHWAFVADYVRLYALLNEGGVYFDTDMLLVNKIDNLLEYDLFLAEEEPGVINVAAMGSVRKNDFISKCKNYYDNNMTERVTIPKVVTMLYKDYKNNTNTIVLKPESFYPFTPLNIKNYKRQKLSNETYGIHLWNYSWGHPLNKFLMKIGVYTYIKKITEILCIKRLLKKLFNIV